MEIGNIFNFFKKPKQRSYAYDASRESRADEPFDKLATQGEIMRGMERPILLARARALERTNPLIGAILSALKNNVIGTGFNMQARSPDEKFNKRIEELWKDWEHHENCDYTQQQGLTDLLKLILCRYFVDGGILITFPMDKEREIPLTIQLHTVDSFDSLEGFKADKNHVLVDGIEMDTGGKVIAYWIKQTLSDGYTEIEPIRVDAKDAIYLWNKSMPNQSREITQLARDIIPAKDLMDYINVVAMQQKLMASMAIFVERDQGATGVVGRGINTTDGKRIEKFEGGTISYLRNGERMKQPMPTGQASEVGNYMPLQQRLISADLGLSLESTARNVERVNYSSARQNLLSDKVTYDTMKKTLVEYVLRPLYKRFIDVCELKGYLDDTSFKRGDKRFYKADWLAPSIGWIDPRKEAEANSINLMNGGKSFQEFCAEQGVDWRERINAMKEVQDYAKQQGVELSFNTMNGGEKNDKEDKEND